MGVTVYDRRTRTLRDEPQYAEKQLRFLYGTVLGRWLLWLVFSRRYFSRLYGQVQRLPFTARKIGLFIDRYGIDMSEYEPQRYASFAEFFGRSLKTAARPVSSRPGNLVAVADSKLMVYTIDATGRIVIKHSAYTAGELLGDAGLASDFAGGTCLVFRLSIDDCHHYVYPGSGHLSDTRAIPGRLHTIRPLADRKFRSFTQNYRVISIMDTDSFGRVVQIEIGALLVGHIFNYPLDHFVRGQHKGYFGLGGSTIVVMLMPNVVKIDKDIIDQSNRGIETKVITGETIGAAA